MEIIGRVGKLQWKVSFKIRFRKFFGSKHEIKKPR